MYTINLNDDYIKLGQALKAAGLVSSGVEAKIVIQGGEVKVNGQIEKQRGKKLVDGDVVTYGDEEIKISHVAYDRKIFAAGAILAAERLLKIKTPGLYSMSDIF